MSAVSVSRPYFHEAFSASGRDVAISFAAHVKERVGFDTVVVTGVSGTVMGGVIAHALGCSLLVVRKDDDTSTHSWSRVEGDLGERWVFLDDFIDTGSTRTRVKRAVRDLVARRAETRAPVKTRFVGTIGYQDRQFWNGRDVEVFDV